MPSVTIRDVPADARDELAARARRRGQSLQEYLRGLLVQQAASADLEEWVAAARRRVRDTGSSLSTEDILRLRDEERDEA